MSTINSLSASMSGMLAAIAQINGAASNIANLHTPGYKAIRRELSPLPDYGGVAIGSISDRQPTPSQPSGQSDSSGEDDSDVDLTSQVMQLNQSQILYDANAAVIRSTSQMTGTLLDMFDTDDNSQSAAA